MAEVGFYRYVSAGELASLRRSRTIQSQSGVTYFTPERYDDPQEAYRKLASYAVPEHRIGPIPADEMPDFDQVPLRPVGFKDRDRPGGGVEAATSKPVHLFSIYDFHSGTVEAH